MHFPHHIEMFITFEQKINRKYLRHDGEVIASRRLEFSSTFFFQSSYFFSVVLRAAFDTSQTIRRTKAMYQPREAWQTGNNQFQLQQQQKNERKCK